MARLEDIVVNASVSGIVGSASVNIVAVNWHGTNAITATYRDNAGNVSEQILYREDEVRLSVTDNALPWSLDADANLLRLVSEAYRINLAHLFDPYLAVHTSETDKPDTSIIWLLTQQLTKAMEDDGVTGAATIIADMLTSEPEQAKALAYRLFTLAERKGWAQEAYAYNSLVIAWPEVLIKAADIKSKQTQTKQMSMFDN